VCLRRRRVRNLGSDATRLHAQAAVRDDVRVGGGIDDVAMTVAALSRAAGTALDPSSILGRTVAVLEDVIDLGRVSLWRSTRGGVELVATHPRADLELRELDLDAESAVQGALSIPLDGRTTSLGRLVVSSRSGEPFRPHEQALLDIAASQVAGALERAQLFAEVMELERLKSDFIARVSHELRTPITIINGFLETLIAHDERLDAEQRLHMLERSRAASSRLGDLIEELLILSRIEGGVLTPQPENLVLSRVFEVVRSAAAEPEQVLVTGAVDDRIVTDRALLVRALGLLVDNAVKYGGVAELSTCLEGDRRLIEVRDRGPGFPDDVRATAFELFTRSQSSSAVPGLGVGLAIARTLVEVLDGTIGIVDTPAGPGAIVRVSLPG
jgi:K+-sensing histidine kinase KdpD